MERARGIRRLLQSMLFPDLDHLLDAAEELDRRMDLLDKSIGVLDKTVAILDKSVEQVDRGMVQLDHGMNRLDKEMSRMNKGMDQLNKGMDQLNKDVDEREKDLTIRLENLKAKLEADHARAMGEVASLLETHAFEERGTAHEGYEGHDAANEHPVRGHLHPQQERARAISELQAALGPQAPVEELLTHVEPDPGHARALDELAALLSSARRREEVRRDEPKRDELRPLELKDDADRHAKATNGHPPPLDFAAILEHIRNREAAV